MPRYLFKIGEKNVYIKKSCLTVSIATLPWLSPTGNNHFSTNKNADKLWRARTVEYYSASNKSERQLLSSRWSSDVLC